MKTITLNNGVQIPVLGFGVFQIPDLQECKRSVLDAIECGYRLIDTASSYGNEKAVGEAIKESGVPREELFITTKLWVKDTNYEGAKRAVETSLSRLRLEYLDLYLIHQPYNDIFGAWRAMEELYNEGKLRGIGVSNFSPDRLLDLTLFNKIKPTINQIETHPLFQQDSQNQFLREQNIQHQSWGPFAEGRGEIFTHPLLTQIADSHNKSVAQVILRWLIQREIIAIPKTTSKARMKENFEIFDFELSSEQMAQIATLDQNVSQFFDHRDPKMIQWFYERTLKESQ